MADTYNSYQPDYSFDNGQYDDGQGESQSHVGDFDSGVDIRGIDYGRDTRGRELEYGRDNGRASDYVYDGSRGGGDRGGGYNRDGIRGDVTDSNRFSDGYDDNRGSSRDRERERERSRRDRDGRRERRRDRDHERSRERRERRERDRSPSSRYDDSYSLDGSEGDSQSYRDRERDARDLREDRGGEKWMTDTPTNTVLLRGLPPQVDEKDIRAELMMFGAPVKDVRLMRRSTGASRGFAFVEFQNVTDAQRWMDQKQGALDMLNQYHVSMHYSTPRVGPEKFVQHKTDWTCSKCGVHNFKRRDYCFKCNISRDESDKTKDGDGFDQVGTNPCNTLIFRGLDALTTEESLDVALRLQTNLQSKNVRIIRDPVTNTSRGYGFCEMNSIQESTQVIDFLTRNNVPLEVDGKQVLTSYAKNTFSTVMATLNSTPQNPAWDFNSQQGTGAGQQGTEYYNQLYQAGVTTTTSPTTTGPSSGNPGEFDQTYYDQATGQYYDTQSYEYSQYYSQYGQSGSQPLQTDSTNAAAAVAQAAIAQANAAKNYNKQTPGSKKAEPVVEQPATPSARNKDVLAYPAPDVSTYQFDKSSGYYYDPTTGLYYDPNSQVPCPVKSCSVKLEWLELRDHWFSVHKPTITTYRCPHPKCQFKSSENTIPFKHGFITHIYKVHGIRREKQDLLLKLAKTECKENVDYVDPGKAVCPQPVKARGPLSSTGKTQAKINPGVKRNLSAMVASTPAFTGPAKRQKLGNPNLVQVNTVYVPKQVKHEKGNPTRVAITKSSPLQTSELASQPSPKQSPQPALQTLTQKVVQPATNKKIESEHQPASEPAPQKSTEPENRSESEPTLQQATEPENRSESEPTLQQATEPTPQQSTEPENRSESEPTLRQRTEPENRSESEPAPQQATEPENQPASEPIPQQSTEPDNRSESELTSLQAIEPVNITTSEQTPQAAVPENQPASEPRKDMAEAVGMQPSNSNKHASTANLSVAGSLGMTEKSLPEEQVDDLGPITDRTLGLDTLEKTDVPDVIPALCKEAESNLTQTKKPSSSSVMNSANRSSVPYITQDACTAKEKEETNISVVIRSQTEVNQKICVLVGRQTVRPPAVSKGKKKLTTGVLTKIATPSSQQRTGVKEKASQGTAVRTENVTLTSTQPSTRIKKKVSQKTAIKTKDVTLSRSQPSISPKAKRTQTVSSGRQLSRQSRGSRKDKDAVKAPAAPEVGHSSGRSKGIKKGHGPSVTPSRRPRVIEVAHPSSVLPRMGVTEEELKCFMSWTCEYLVILRKAREKASRQLMKLTEKE